MGAEWCGHALVISGAVRMARLREAQEHPDWMGRGAPSSHSRPGGSHAAGASPPVRGPGHRSVAEKSGSNLRHGICRRQLSCYPARSLSTARIWSISCSNWFNSPKHWTTITKLCSGSSNRRPLGGLSAPKWLWPPLTRRRRNRMKSIRNSISNACWALSQLPSC